jgi:hypothetical protein
MWEERERTRTEIMAQIDLAETSLARGEGRIITPDSMRELAEEVKQRGRARLASEQPGPGALNGSAGFHRRPKQSLMTSGITSLRESGSIDAADRLMDSITP